MPATTSKHHIPYPLPAERVADFPTVARQLAEKLEAIIPTDGKILINGTLYAQSGVIRNFSRPKLELRNGHYAASITVNHPFTPPPGYVFTYTVEESSGFTFIARGNGTSTNTTLRIFQVANGDNNALSAIRYFLVKS